MYADYLAHYGVKGMKWGVRKKRETEGQKRQLTPEQQAKRNKRRRALGIAGGVAGAALATAGGIYAYKNRKEISGALGKKMNANRIRELKRDKDISFSKFSDVLDLSMKAFEEKNYSHERFYSSIASDIRKTLDNYDSLISRLNSAPMTKSKYNAGKQYIDRLVSNANIKLWGGPD